MIRTIVTTCALLVSCSQSASSAGEPAKLDGDAQKTYLRAQTGKRFSEAATLHPDILPTSDGKSFIVVWNPSDKKPQRWIVSLRGTHGFATDDLAIWYPSIKKRDVGLVSGTRWITSAGGRDPNPDRDGIPGMQRTATWLKEQGATVVLSIEDPKAGHGALQLKPDNVRRALDVFLK